MIHYKDQTFCQDWCSNTECFRNIEHTKGNKDAQGRDILPICFFVEPPKDCTKRIDNGNRVHRT